MVFAGFFKEKITAKYLVVLIREAAVENKEIIVFSHITEQLETQEQMNILRTEVTS